MTGRKMPVLGGRHYGARAGSLGKPLTEAESEYRANHNPSPHDIGEFRTGYVVGQISAVISCLHGWQKYGTREQLQELLADLTPVASKWDCEAS